MTVGFLQGLRARRGAHDQPESSCGRCDRTRTTTENSRRVGSAGASAQCRSSHAEYLKAAREPIASVPRGTRAFSIGYPAARRRRYASLALRSSLHRSTACAQTALDVQPNAPSNDPSWSVIARAAAGDPTDEHRPRLRERDLQAYQQICPWTALVRLVPKGSAGSRLQYWQANVCPGTWSAGSAPDST